MIRFGTSGWRDIISDRFTFENVRRVSRAIATLIKEEDRLRQAGVAVGFDTRFLSPEFAAEVARVMIAEDVPVYLARNFLPTPVLAFSITSKNLAGGINVTASHNPPEYNGLKFSTADGAPAPPEVTSRIESLIETVSGAPVAAGAPPLELDPQEAYFRRLDDLIRRQAFHSRPLRVGFDGRFGTSRGWLDRYLEDLGVEVVKVNDRRDPLFGGGSPGCSGENLSTLRQVVIKEGLDLGLATDGDGDRFGIVDRDGTEVAPNLVLALLVDYLSESRGWRQGVGRTVATTHLIDKVAARHGFPVHETPVGFKFFGPLLGEGRIFMGAEESAGMSIKGHVPEKDGILANLLVAEMVAARDASLKVQVEQLFDQVGCVLSRRVDTRFEPSKRDQLLDRLSKPLGVLAGVPVEKTVTVDGYKWIRSDGCWLLVRVSGTEPVVRVYAEAGDRSTLDAIVEQGVALLP